MIITKIEKQKNNAKRYSIFIDNSFAFGIDEIDLLYYKLAENQPLDTKKYDFIVNELLFKRAKDKAVKYLSYKMRSKKQVVKKLEEYEFPTDVIDRVIVLLEKYNYLNDQDFAKAYIKDKMNLKGYGTFKISYDLKQLGVEQDIIDKYLKEEPFIDENEKAREILQKKLKNKNISELDYKERQKLYAYLARRGFSYDSINNALNNILEDY